MPTLPTSDLRSEAKAYRRDKNHSVKWARGARVAPGKRCSHTITGSSQESCGACTVRPLNRDGDRNHSTHSYHRAEKVSGHIPAHRQGSIAKKVLQNDLNEVTLASDTNSSDDEIIEASAAPVPDAGVMYSYDAPSGPSTGSDILSHAIMQAVQRFENKQTEKLVQNEYDVVLDGKELEDAYAGDAEDDFEVIDFQHL